MPGCELRLSNSVVEATPEKDIYRAGETVSFSCKSKGYTLKPKDHKIRCYMSGPGTYKWSGKMPKCRKMGTLLLCAFYIGIINIYSSIRCKKMRTWKST